MAIRITTIDAVESVRPLSVPRGMPRYSTDRARRDIREFRQSGESACEVVGVIPDDPTMRDVSKAAHAYRKLCAHDEGVAAVQRGRRIFLLRRDDPRCHELVGGRDG